MIGRATPSPLAVVGVALGLLCTACADRDRARAPDASPADVDLFDAPGSLDAARDGAPHASADIIVDDVTTDPDGSADAPRIGQLLGEPSTPFAHTFAYDRLDDPLAIGPGGGLVDIDDDGDLDVFLGDTPGGTGACVYRNRSQRGTPRFEPIPSLCAIDWPRRVTVAATVPTPDGDRVLVGGYRFLSWLPDVTDPTGATPPNLLEVFDGDDQRRRCNVSSVTPLDLDLDGEFELYVGCGHSAATSGRVPNFALELDPTGGVTAWPTEALGALADEGATLAVAVVDANSDGFLDVYVLNDTLSRPGVRNMTEPPGGLWLGGESPAVGELQPLAENAAAWASFMGAGAWNGGPELYLTDAGPNRVVGARDGIATVEGVNADPLALGPPDATLFHWAAVPLDLDGDGDDDLLVTAGDVYPDRIEAALDVGHRDAWIETRAGVEPVVRLRAEFSALSEPTNHRAAAAFDADGDGRADLFTLPLVGTPLLEPTTASPAGCYVRVEGTVVPTQGLGVRWWADGDSPDSGRALGVAGASRFGLPPGGWVTARSGTVEFPSGWRASFDCADIRVRVTEPKWLTAQRVGEVVRFVGPEDIRWWVWVGGELSVHASGDHVPRQAPMFVGAQRADGRWIARVWRWE